MRSMSAVVEENMAASEQMSAQSSGVSSAITSIAELASSQSASTRQVMYRTEAMTHDVGDMSTQLDGLADTVTGLERLVGRFKLAASAPKAASVRLLRAA
jgi:methyl-accepting chemotaxis protein